MIRHEKPVSGLLQRARLAHHSSQRHRERLADSIDGLIAAAGGPVGRMRVAPARESVLANARGLRELEQLLRARSPVHARGLESLTSLLSDGTGPVFRGDAGALGESLGEVRAELFATGVQRGGAR